MIQEIVDYYFENRIPSVITDFVKFADLKKYTAPKLDRDVFDDYVRRQYAADATKDLFKLEAHERLHKLERVTHDYVLKE